MYPVTRDMPGYYPSRGWIKWIKWIKWKYAYTSQSDLGAMMMMLMERVELPPALQACWMQPGSTQLLQALLNQVSGCCTA
jgi:hypothetical protein